MSALAKFLAKIGEGGIKGIEGMGKGLGMLEKKAAMYPKSSSGLAGAVAGASGASLMGGDEEEEMLPDEEEAEKQAILERLGLA